MCLNQSRNLKKKRNKINIFRLDKKEEEEKISCFCISGKKTIE